MWVVKVGGSLAQAEVLPHWLEVLGNEGGGRVVIVPGGGPFADQVRSAQAFWAFDDATAHRMAVLAMDQYGLLMTGLRPDLVPVFTEAEIRRALGEARVPVWMPSVMLRDGFELPRCWEVTSDSLAAWFATRLGASRLLLVKSVDVDASEISAAHLAKRDVVDATLPSLVARSGFSTWVIGREHYPRIKHALTDRNAAAGTRVVATEPLGENDAGWNFV